MAAFRRSLEPALTGTAGEQSGPGFADPPSLGLDGGGFSTTYRLEADVDEHDFVRYDGRHLYIAPTRGLDCCFPVEPFITDAALVVPPPASDGPRRIRIMATDTESASAMEVGAVELDEGLSVEGLYIDGTRLTALTSSAWLGQHGAAFASIAAWESHSVGLTVYDVSDAANPQATFSIELSGALVASRRIGDAVIVVTRHLPRIPDLKYAPLTDAERAQNQAVLDGVGVDALLPIIRVNGERRVDALTAQDCLLTDPTHPIASAQPGYPVITTVLSIDTSVGSLIQSLCYAEPADGVYMSADALYIAQTVYDDPRAVDSIVHRIDLDDGLHYRGSGRVSGSLVGRGQADFRMSESAGVLRLVTTRFNNDESDAFDHRLYTLRLAPQSPELELVAQLPARGSEDVIGKPNEDLYGVRFVGNRAYLVTFERIDPLYVIDLADPAAPAILGELEVSGFSDLLHPVSEDLLLGLGDDGEGRVKLELFDVADPAQPRSQGLAILAAEARWSYSDARYDRRAFTYLPDVGGVDRIAVPVSLGVETNAGVAGEERLYMFELQNKATPATATLKELGFIAARQTSSVEARPRSVLDADAVYFVLGDRVWSGFWGRGGSALGPF